MFIPELKPILIKGNVSVYPTLKYRTEVIRAEKVNNLVGVDQGPKQIADLLSKVIFFIPVKLDIQAGCR